MKSTFCLLLLVLFCSVNSFGIDDLSEPPPGFKKKETQNSSQNQGTSSQGYSPQNTVGPVCCEVNDGSHLLRQSRKNKESCEQTGAFSKVLYQGACQ